MDPRNFSIDNAILAGFEVRNGSSENIMNEINSFIEPYDELWKKILGTLMYVIQIFCGLVILTLIRYEREGYAGSFRTALNQLTSWKYLIVSYVCWIFYQLHKKKEILFSQLI